MFYAAAKAYVASITRSMAREYAADRIRVNAVAPGVLSTPTLDRYAPPELVRQLAAAVPMRRSGDAQEVAGRSEEHTSELPSLMRISYAVFCLKKKKRHSYIQSTYYY